MKGEEKTPILSNENSNISFYLYKIVKQLVRLFILNVRPFLYEIFFLFGLRPQAFACLA